ncbi:MAG: MBL fold metallo-hydrolase [Methylobacteriaceae bacterium]|nr:MBL fold metallo-hydrolase [Methylobacteriaceae bacterium]
MRIEVVGCGDAFGSGGRFNTCLHVAQGEEALLVDCGASSLVALNRTAIDRNKVAAILFTHFHGDHFAGLPFFLLDAQFNTRRRAALTIAGPRGVEMRARTVCEALFPGAFDAQRVFETRFVEIAPDAPATLAGFAIAAFPMVHDERVGPCLGYRIARAGKVVAFSGDSGWCDSLPALVAGADVALIECYQRDRTLPNHLDWSVLAARLPRATIGRLILTHMARSMLAGEAPQGAERAFDGMVIEL